MRLTGLARCVAAAFPRGQYAHLTASDLSAFRGIVGNEYVRTEDIDNYTTDWTRQMKGSSECVLLPSTDEEVCAVLKHCSTRKLSVVLQIAVDELVIKGGRTGLVGGATPVHDEIILATDRIRSHFHLDPFSGVLSVDAGFVVEEADSRVAEEGFMMPLDLGSKGSCQIGGCIAAGAGGIRLLRYGSLHSHLLGLTIIDGMGRKLELGSSLRKDNTALHAAHLAIGSEGQLGVITRVTMGVVPRPFSILSAMLGVSSFDGCLSVLSLARRKLGEILSSFELIDGQTMLANKRNLNLNSPFKDEHQFNLLIETHGSNGDHDSEKLDGFLEEVLKEGLADDGVAAQNDSERAYMWRLREEAPVGLMKDGYIYKYDVSLPHKFFYRLIEETRERLGDRANVYCYGHLGDGNAHLNVTTLKEDKHIKQSLSPWVYSWVASHGGSISAEHGIGQLKRDYRHIGKSREEGDLMRALKAVYDPRGILCPYKMIN